MKLWAVAALCTATAAAASALPGCTDDGQCPDGNFCSAVLLRCVPCLRCADYSRGGGGDTCAKSAGDCGDCLPGFKTSYKLHECVDAASADADDEMARGLPYYVWVPMSLLILLALALAIACALRLMRTKVFSTTCAAIYSAPGDAEAPRCSSPECSAPPPPYNLAVNNNYQPSSPPPPPAHDADTTDDGAGDTARRTFVERADSVYLRGHKESDTSQEARIYNYPNYITEPQLPPSYDDAVSDESNSQGLPADEETVQSTWTHAADPAAPSSLNLSALLSEARGRELVRAPDARAPDPAEPPAKILRVRTGEEESSARMRGATEAGDAPSTSAAPAPAAAPPPAPPASVTFNINLQQLTDVKLLRL